jgi:DNA-binding NarL/FixJ family response regulator
VSDDQMLADALSSRLVQEADDLLIKHSAGEVSPALAITRAHGTAVLVIDAGSVTGHWSAIADAVTSAHPDIRVVVLAEGLDAEDAVLAALRGVPAWLPPELTLEGLIEVLRGVGVGYAYYPPTVLGDVLRRLAGEPGHRRAGSGPLAALTERERDVLACLVAGRHGQEIAEHLDIAANTVRSHTNRILHKLGVHSRLEAVRVAREYGFEPSSTSPGTRTPGRAIPQVDHIV